MAATEQPRRFITRTAVEDAAAAGQPIRLGPRDVITDEAAERARDLHVRVDHTAMTAAPATGAASAGRSRSVDSEALRSAVRAGVIAELGMEPPGLEAALDKALAKRSPS